MLDGKNMHGVIYLFTEVDKMKSKSRRIRECLRCQYGKEVIRQIIQKECKGYSIEMLPGDECKNRLKSLLVVVLRAWGKPQMAYQPYEEGILLDMYEECHAYEEMLLDWYDDGVADDDWAMYYTTKSSGIIGVLTKYSALQYSKMLSEEDEGRFDDDENGRQVATVRRVITDFSKIKYSKQFREYLRATRKPKSNAPDVVMSLDSCVHIIPENRSADAVSQLEEFMDIVNRVGKLPDNYRKLFWDVYDHAPTSFGMNLSTVMDSKTMSANDVFMLVKPYSSNPKMRPSIIQSMMECTFPDANRELIPYIARALLVDESVLYSGVGRSWGTWAYQLDTGFIESTMRNPRGMVVKVREEARRGIIGTIESGESLHEYLDEVANWEISEYRDTYAETTITICPDRKQRWRVLRQRESLMIFLSCLEARAALECSSNAPVKT